MNDLERFNACMEYRSADARPNHELGAWAQTRTRWKKENPAAVANFKWNWFTGEDALGLDRREFLSINFGFLPPFDVEVVERTPEYELIRNAKGILTRALIEGTEGGQRTCMDEYIDFPVKGPEDFHALKKRLIAAAPARYPADLDAKIEAWKQRIRPLALGTNTAAGGFYWRAREYMGTENLSYAWYDQPKLMHEMMEFFADFVIETARPVVEKIQVDYFNLSEDMAMKNGPLLGPDTFREFIFPHLKRLVEFFHSHGVKHVSVDSDGNPTVLIPLLLDAGVDTVWPIERASDSSPLEWRQKFGKSLRLWGGVDKRVLKQGSEAIRAHLREFIPLIEEGGFIPTVDHTVPPDVSWDNFRYYMDGKVALLRGDFSKLE